MKKVLLFFWIFGAPAMMGQTKADYRSTEDGLTQLLTTPEFVQELAQTKTEDLSLKKLSEYFVKYLPEYADYKPSGPINPNKVYYANTRGLSSEVVAKGLSALLQSDGAQKQLIEQVLSGAVPASSYGSKALNPWNDPGKKPARDRVLENAVDFFKGKWDSPKMTAGMLDLGGVVLGSLLRQFDQKYQAKMAEMKRVDSLLANQQVYLLGKPATGLLRPSQKALYLHHQAHTAMAHRTQTQTSDYPQAIALLDQAIAAYQQQPQHAYYMYLAYVQRAQCKMQCGVFRAAITDLYYAQEVLDLILSGQLPDQSLRFIYPKGYFDTTHKETLYKGTPQPSYQTLSAKDQVVVLMNRAYAKFRTGDHIGAMADAENAQKILRNKAVPGTGQPNDYKDLCQALIAMANFGLGQFDAAYEAFGKASLNADLYADRDGDGTANFMDENDQGAPAIADREEGYRKTELYGFPDYFPFDIAQIRGLCLYKKARYDDAIAIYESIVSTEHAKSASLQEFQKMFTAAGGDISAIYSSLSSFYEVKGNPNKALELIKKALEISPDQPEYQAKLAAYQQEKDPRGTPADMINPPAASKTEEYYQTKYVQFSQTENQAERFAVIAQAIKDHPQNQQFYHWATAFVALSQNASQAQQLAQSYPQDSKEYNVLMALHNRYNAHPVQEQAHIEKAFAQGLTFYELAHKDTDLLIKSRPYYCALLLQFLTKDNNSFVPPAHEKPAVLRSLDSTYTALQKQYSGVPAVLKSMEALKKEQYLQINAQFDQLLKQLDSQPAALEMNPVSSYTKLEALLALGRKEEAMAFAKKVVKAGKFLPIMAEDPNANTVRAYQDALANMAGGACN